MVIRRNKSAALNIYITPELKAAAADQRSLTSLIEMLFTRHCQQHRFLPADPKPRRSR